jgi:glutamate-1-semialdehyde 2,1-aminomutase
MDISTLEHSFYNPEVLFESSKKIIPGGVHSPVRSFKGMEMAPRFFTHAEGAMITDTEGKDYIDFCMSFGPLILGHRDPIVEEALHSALKRGWSYGACEPYSLQLAEYLIKKLPFIDQIRFVNSGTEAVMTAIRLARGYTGKDKIIKFNGCYHGHLDSMLIKAGSGLAGTAAASSAGVPEGVARDTLIVELDDLSGLKQCLEAWKGQIAAICIEPLPANNGLLPQKIEFLKAIRTLCTEHNIVLLFDEVISGLRMSFGGMAEMTGIKPDLVTYGKVIGGGMPVGAVAGKKEIMQMLAPLGPVYQAGTLSANPLAMVAGLATVQQLTCHLYEQMEKSAIEICALFEAFIKRKKLKLHVVREGTLFWFSPEKNIRRIDQIPATISENFNPFFKEMLKRGIYLAPNAYEVGFVSKAHNQSIIQMLSNRLA